MAIDYSVLALPKGTPRVVDRVRYKREREADERACRKVVKARDHGRCRIPNCREAAVHLHHILYRSKGGKWKPENIASLCVYHHGLVHSGLIRIEGNANEELVITGRMDLLTFKL